jgi:hypothetical protein
VSCIGFQAKISRQAEASLTLFVWLLGKEVRMMPYAFKFVNFDNPNEFYIGRSIRTKKEALRIRRDERELAWYGRQALTNASPGSYCRRIIRIGK